MAIGNYWECVTPPGEDTPLQRIIAESSVLSRQEFPVWRFEPDGEDEGGAEFFCLGFTTGDLRAIAHVVKPRGQGNYLHSAFPWLASGAPVRLNLKRIDTDHFGLEGFLSVDLADGPSARFFDPLFALNKGRYKAQKPQTLLNKGRYKIGTEYLFSLGAFSLDLKLATPEPVRITNPETAAHFRETAAASGRAYGPAEPVEIDTSRAKILMGAAKDAPDYYCFEGPVRTIRKTDFLDRPFLVFRTAVVDLQPGDFLVDIYMDRARFQPGMTPTAGDMVSGTLWLQGCLTE